MFRNYLAAALRNLVRNRLYAAINIIGLTVGFAAALLIALFIRDEFSYDKWIPGADQTYLLSQTAHFTNGSVYRFDSSPVAMAALLKAQIPGIERASRAALAGGALRRGEVEANETIWWADPDFFQVLRLPVLAGDLDTALREPDGIVITRAMARKYFGSDTPLGETIEINRVHPMRITAILEDQPPNTTVKGQIFASGRASFSRLTEREAQAAAQGRLQPTVYTFLRLRPAADARRYEGDIAQAVERNLADAVTAAAGGGKSDSFSLLALADIHLTPERSSPVGAVGSRPVLMVIAFVGLLIITIASINFVNLVVARGSHRAVEVGVRKVSGAYRLHLMVQFIGEAVAYAGVSVLFAAVLAELARPAFSNVLGHDFAARLWRDPALLSIAIGLALAVGVIAGAYPAFVLSSYRPATAVKGGIDKAGAGGWLRKGLVIFQFTVLVLLTLSVGTMYRQIRYVTNDAVHLDLDQVLLVNASCTSRFAAEVGTLDGVKDVACSSANAAGGGTAIGPKTLPDGSQVIAAQASVGVGFFELYGLHPVAGRFFSADHATDVVPAGASAKPAAVVINETAVRKFNFGSPAAALGQSLRLGGDTAPASQVIGVVSDFATNNVRDLVYPTAYFADANQFGVLNLKLQGKKLPETLEAIDRLWKQAGEPHPIERTFFDQKIERNFITFARQAKVFTSFAALAVFIAGLGLFGLSSFLAEQRTKEIGVRKAMGARTGDILRLFVWQFAQPVLCANLIAWPLGYLAMRAWLEDFAYHIDPELWIFAAASGLAFVIAVLTVASHVLTVARAQPVTALRYE